VITPRRSRRTTDQRAEAHSSTPVQLQQDGARRPGALLTTVGFRIQRRPLTVPRGVCLLHGGALAIRRARARSAMGGRGGGGPELTPVLRRRGRDQAVCCAEGGLPRVPAPHQGGEWSGPADPRLSGWAERGGREESEQRRRRRRMRANDQKRDGMRARGRRARGACWNEMDGGGPNLRSGCDPSGRV
jgi:hypothetical protein